ncbi:MAG: exodeoxyribonuclease VII large subunit [Candidatus Moranbacteria bacterium]|nr:exodeoxyribonuclease VII large subunit [Candidatus Moranbacteria bacterium]
MAKNLLQKLKDWRAKTARRENVELFRVISNQALEEIAAKQPQSKVELLEVKGIKEKKYAKYGEEILALVRKSESSTLGSVPRVELSDSEKIFEVGEYLDFLNEKLLDAEARVKGEVSSIDIRGNYIFFSIKGKDEESLISCFVWKNDYQTSGVDLEEGMEVVIWGYPNVYKPSGRLSFQTKLIELVGEGLLKKAYEELKRKLEAEGVFAPERKKILPKYIQRIGLITSHQGAAIGDFISNIGNYGYQIKFFDSRVEGKQAVFELVKGVKWLNKNMPDLDAIVLVRGGGSLESLQAFNTEALVREIAGSKIPVLAGVGHEQDVTLAALAADKMVSTPTAAALEIRRAWDEAIHGVESNEKYILNAFQNILSEKKNIILESERTLSGKLADIFERFRRARENLKNNLVKIKMTIDYDRNYLSNASRKLVSDYRRLFSDFKNMLKSLAEKIIIHNPERQLKLGYSLVSFNNKIVRSVKSVQIGDEVDVKMSDGKLRSQIKEIVVNKN